MSISCLPTVALISNKLSEDAPTGKAKVGHAWKPVNEDAPTGKTQTGKPWEKVVKKLKQKPGVKNPWAVAHSMKNKQEQ